MLPELQFCLIGLDLGLVISSEQMKRAGVLRYMSVENFKWVGVFKTPLINEQHRFGVVVLNDDNDWTLTQTHETREASTAMVQSLQQQAIHCMEIELVQGR